MLPERPLQQRRPVGLRAEFRPDDAADARYRTLLEG